MAGSSYNRISGQQADKIKKIPKLPELPPLPVKLTNAFPDMKKWYDDYKKWLEDYTATMIKSL